MKRILQSTPDQSITVKDTPIKWKAQSGDKRKHSEQSFMSLFVDESEDILELLNILITDFYPNVISYYQGDDEDSDDEIDLEEFESGDEQEQ